MADGAAERENFHVKFVERPGVNGEAKEEYFRFEKCAEANLPDSEEGGGHVLVKNLYLSVDPALRCRMNESTGVAYLVPWGIGETVSGLGGVGVVMESSSNEFATGDIVAASMGWPWKLRFVISEDQLVKVSRIPTGYSPSIVLSCLGLIGLTALLGVQEMGHIQPGKNQIFVVSGAGGACGSLAGQIARLRGCGKVIGICGGAEKCKFLSDELNFDAAIDYKNDDVGKKLEECCPNGIDVYFDNVGGPISEEVIKKMNLDSHIVLCGQISQYNKDVPYPPPLSDDTQKLVKANNITRDRFLVLNYQQLFPMGLLQLEKWLSSGELKVKESTVEGLENAGKAFVGMMRGENIGKQIVRVSPLQ